MAASLTIVPPTEPAIKFMWNEPKPYNLEDIKGEIMPDVETLLNPIKSSTFIYNKLEDESKKYGVDLADLVNQLTEDPNYLALIFEALWAKWKVRSYREMLTESSWHGFINIVEEILKADKNNARLTPYDYTSAALSSIKSNSDINLVRLILRYGAEAYKMIDPYAEEYPWQSKVVIMGDEYWDSFHNLVNYNDVMIKAARYDRMDIIKLILELDEIGRAKYDEWSLPPIHKIDYNATMVEGAKYGNVDIIGLMLELGATDYDETIVEAENYGHMYVRNYITKWKEGQRPPREYIR